MHFVEEANRGDSSIGFSHLPRGYYQFKDRIALPQANAEGIQEFNFGDGTTVWWLTHAGALPFRFVTRREFLNKQVENAGESRSTPSARGWRTTRDCSASHPMTSRSSRRSRCRPE